MYDSYFTPLSGFISSHIAGVDNYLQHNSTGCLMQCQLLTYSAGVLYSLIGITKATLSILRSEKDVKSGTYKDLIYAKTNEKGDFIFDIPGGMYFFAALTDSAQKESALDVF